MQSIVGWARPGCLRLCGNQASVALVVVLLSCAATPRAAESPATVGPDKSKLEDDFRSLVQPTGPALANGAAKLPSLTRATPSCRCKVCLKRVRGCAR